MIKLNYLVRVAMIAAIYVVLNVIFAPISYGPIQVRIAEALVILPFIDSSAIIGLFLGCILANIYGIRDGGYNWGKSLYFNCCIFNLQSKKT